MTTDTPTPCRHGPAKQDCDPDTGDVWCFACKPPRNLSADWRHQRKEDAALPAGMFYTPATICDPAAGSGGLLAAISNPPYDVP
jgi:hypothetical protein